MKSQQLAMKVILVTIFIGLIATTYAEFEPKCPKDGTGSGFLPNPEDCKKLWICTEHVPHAAYCPSELYFDVKTLTCVDEDEAICAGTLAPPPSLPEEPKEPEEPKLPEQPEEPEQPERPPVDCPKKMKPTDNVLLANPKDCGSFYQCVYGYPYLMQCPQGLHYNSRRTLCDWPELAKCTITP